ncbi:MAG: dodecin family protein [Hyphomicrobiaceae bacterium]
MSSSSPPQESQMDGAAMDTSSTFVPMNMSGLQKHSVLDRRRKPERCCRRSPMQLTTARAGKTIRNMRWFEVMSSRGNIQGDAVLHWQVTIRI